MSKANEPAENTAPDNGAAPPDEARLAAWMRLALVVLFILVVVGGTVRLTGSGMSIPQWPIIYYGDNKTQPSVLPPFTEARWKVVYETYHHMVVKPKAESDYIPMSRFKREFWTEWSHRAVAGFFGIVFLAILVQTAVNRNLRRKVGPLLTVAVVVLASQIVLGGHVVINDTHPFYVSFHLGTAFIFIALVLWAAMRLNRPDSEPRPEKAPRLTKWALVAVVACFLQVFTGGIVAKTGAAKEYNTWPKIAGTYIPPAETLWQPIEPPINNFLTNKILIQFVHRWLAFLVLAAVVNLIARLIAKPLTRAGRLATRAAAFVVVLQIMLGIMTLLNAVPYPLAILHLATGLCLFQLLVVLLFEVRNNNGIAELEAAADAREAEEVRKLEAARVS